MAPSSHALPVIPLETFLTNTTSKEALEACETLAQELRHKGILIVRDPRVSEADNAAFLDLLERYFARDECDRMRDVRGDIGYQVGATPAGVEMPRCATDEDCLKRIDDIPEEVNKPQVPVGRDPKWRYMWRIGERPSETQFAELNEPQVVPQGMDGWRETMDSWGSKMMACVRTVSEMAAVGFGLRDRYVLRDRLEFGPHLLAPTATDVSRHHATNEIYAGYHYDMNFLTIHGKSRFPGLYVWTSQGERMPVSMPDGCLLLQAGKQLEWLTGGHVAAGMHEVICNEGTQRALEKAKGLGKSTWRISSTLFSHVASDQSLEPVDLFADDADEDMKEKYPPTLAGNYVSAELEHIKLAER